MLWWFLKVYYQSGEEDVFTGDLNQLYGVLEILHRISYRLYKPNKELHEEQTYKKCKENYAPVTHCINTRVGRLSIFWKWMKTHGFGGVNKHGDYFIRSSPKVIIKPGIMFLLGFLICFITDSTVKMWLPSHAIDILSSLSIKDSNILILELLALAERVEAGFNKEEI